MRLIQQILQPPTYQFADYIVVGKEESTRMRTLFWLLSGLFLLALIPRVIMAIQLGAVCDDAYYYIWVAETLEQGDIASASTFLDLNIYPAILMMMHKLGFEWVVGGSIWGVVVSALVVLPLFGWSRRMFNIQVATVASVLYSIHPELIEFSVEPIREQTFWFLFTVVFYLSLRSVVELKWWLFALSGICLTLAIHTRMEGWLLVFPMICWAGFRYFLVTDNRNRLITGPLLSFCTIPLLVVIINLTLLHDQPHWHMGRISMFSECYHWICSQSRSTNQPKHSREISVKSSIPEKNQPQVAKHSTAGTVNPRPAAKKKSNPLDMKSRRKISTAALLHPVRSARKRATRNLGIAERFKIYQQQFIGTLEPINLVLMLIGLILTPKASFQRDKFVLTPLILIVLLGVWIRLASLGSINGRYFFTIYLFSAPCAAIGMIYLIQKASRFFQQATEQTKQLKPWAAGLCILSLLTIFWTDAFTSYHSRRESHAELGNWIRGQLGPFDNVITERSAYRVGYYACNQVPAIPNPPYLFWRMVKENKPDLVIISARNGKENYEAWHADVIWRFSRYGMRRVKGAEAPEIYHDFIAFVRKTDAYDANPKRPALSARRKARKKTRR